MSEDTKAIVASNLPVAAKLIQVVNALKKKTTTSGGDSETLHLFTTLFERLEKGEG